MGMVGITEGAIPFAASDPLRVIPSNMVGAAVGSAVAMTLGAGNPAPWGGWIVAFVSQKPLIYLLASLIGIAVTTAMVVLLKPTLKVADTVEVSPEEDDDDFDIGDLKVM